MEKENCTKSGMAIRDTLDVVGGKWKLPILYTLISNGTLRFKELQRHIDGITARMLSKELKDLELNQMITREVYDTAPITVEYTITDHGMSLGPVVKALHDWGLKHRQQIFEYN
jgi:DNA-binding HxlR family transcriptional regulator